MHYKLWSLVICLLVVFGPGMAEEVSAQATTTPFRISHLGHGDSLRVHGTWLFHEGDDEAWADPAYDDSDWPKAAGCSIDSVPAWTGIGWFRQYIEVDSSQYGRQLAVSLPLIGAADVFFNGRKVYSAGHVSSNPDSEQVVIQLVPEPFVAVVPHTDLLVIAVRFSIHPPEHLNRFKFSPGFRLIIRNYEYGDTEYRHQALLSVRHQMVFTGLALAFFLIHLMVYLFHRDFKEHLYQALFTISIAVLCFTPFQIGFTHSLGWFALNLIAMKISVVATSVFGLWLIYYLMYRRVPRQFWLLAVFGVVIAAASYKLPQAVVYLFAVLVLIETTRVIVQGVIRKKPGAWLMGIGYGCFIIGATYQMAVDLGVLPILIEGFYFYYLYGILALLISMSVLLAWQYTETHKDLAIQLEQVRELSEKAIAQERRAKEQEIAHRLLEQEVEHKQAELEKARELEKAYRELEEATRNLKETQSQLTQSEKMASLGMLVAGVAHEINTPVGAITSMHDTLVRAVGRIKDGVGRKCWNEAGGREELDKFLAIIDDANRVINSGGERVANIVRRLRSFARLDQAELQKANINEGIEDTLVLVHHELKHDIEVVRDFGQLPMVACYPGQLNQVFLNILINARQAIVGKGRIEISTRHLEGWVEIKISDSGKGIDQEHLSRIFDPGFTTKGVGIGTGLGLSICYQIIQDHRGTIKASSKPGEGTTFTIRIPDNLGENMAT